MYCQVSKFHLKKISQDSFFTYTNSHYEGLLPSYVLNELQQNKRITPYFLHNRAVAEMRSFSWGKAQKIWEESIQRYPDFLPPYLCLSRLYFLLIDGDKDKIILSKLYNDLVTNKNISSSTLYMVADKFFYQKGRFEEGILLMKTLEKYRNRQDKGNDSSKKRHFVPASLWLAEYYMAEPNYPKAYLYYKRILRKNPNHLSSFWGIARLAYLSKQWDKAIYYIEKMEEKKKINQKKDRFKRPEKLDYYLANSYFHIQKLEKALQNIKKLHRKLHDYKSLRLYGDILLQQNYQEDLSFLLEMARTNYIRLSLLEYWYGVKNIQKIKNIYPSLIL